MDTDELGELRERAKELRCLYRVHQALVDRSQTPRHAFRTVLEAIPDGWQRPDTTHARIEYLGRHYVAEGFVEQGARLRADICTWNRPVGWIEVVDTAPEGQFLREEQQLLDAIAERLGEYLEWKQQELIGEPIGAATAQWKWRQDFATRLAEQLDPKRFGVRALYLAGSTERGDAAPTSDIDLVLVFEGTPEQRHDLTLWLEGWSLCLAEVAYRQAGCYAPSGLLEVHWVEREPSDPASQHMRALPLGGATR